MPRYCKTCGKEVPVDIKGSYCSRECYLAGKTRSSQSIPPVVAEAAESGTSPSSPEDHPAQPAATSPEQLRGAYRKDQNQTYLGVIETERKRKIDFEREVEEWGIRNPLGGLIYLAKDQVEIGDPRERDMPTTPRPSAAATTRVTPTVSIAKPPLEYGKTPTVVKVLAGIFIGLAAFGVLSSLLNLKAHSIMVGMMKEDGFGFFDEEDPFLFRHIKLFLVLQLLLSVFIIFAAYQFLKLKAWARTVLEVMSWLFIIFAVGFGIFWLVLISSTAGDFPAGEGPPSGFMSLMHLGGFLVILFYLVPVAVLIYFLRSDKVRDAASY